MFEVLYGAIPANAPRAHDIEPEAHQPLPVQPPQPVPAQAQPAPQLPAQPQPLGGTA